MKLHVPANILKSALLCTDQKILKPKHDGFDSIMFELGETSYRIVGSNTALLYVAEIPYGKNDEIDDGDFSVMFACGVPPTLDTKAEVVPVEITSQGVTFEGVHYLDLVDGKVRRGLMQYRKVFPPRTTEQSEGFPFLALKVLNGVEKVKKLGSVEKVHAFGMTKPLIFEFDNRSVLLAMPARPGEERGDYESLFDWIDTNITEY